MKRTGVMLVLLLFVLSSGAQACSSFAIYSNEIVYGMNFDFSTGPDVKFSLHEGVGGKYFLLSFKPGTTFYPIAGMNEHGNFSNLQMVLPRMYTGTAEQQTLQIDEVMLAFIRGDEGIAKVKELVEDFRITHVPANFYLHSMLADPSGKALILEIGDQGNLITHNKDNFLVMTNFYVADFNGDNAKVLGPGSERYRIIDQLIHDNMGKFDLNSNYSMLEKASNMSTQVSMLFYPSKQEIFIVLNRNFQRIWRVSLEKEIIETYRGFPESKRTMLSEVGISSAQLSTWFVN